MLSFLEEYLKHSALNFGQAAQGLRYLLTHPDMDAVAPPGTLRHRAKSLRLRAGRVGNDLVFPLIPPHWHHSREECRSFRAFPVKQWFMAGYAPCRFTETGRMLVPGERVREPRWDPRCRD